jgi:hydrogenase maturation protein HypF
MKPNADIIRTATGESIKRLRIIIKGAVQGVGFRPFIYRLANDLKLSGWIRNTPEGVLMEVEGAPKELERFLIDIAREKPPRSFYHSLEYSYLDPIGFAIFEIRESEQGGAKQAFVLPDIAICPDCLNDIFNPQNRRYLYPFTNCTNCGPRYSIITALPYDRANTSMSRFAMCDRCRAEYDDPEDRRFHAQPNACPECGPQIELWDGEGKVVARRHSALLAAAEALRDGRIAAVKGLGGFHLMTDARNEEAVERLRKLKRREEKPLAVMYPDLSMAAQDCIISDLEERLLTSAESPIVLLEKHPKTGVAYSVAPQNPYLGVMLPYTPLHYILMAELKFPIVATSANISEEPICIDEIEAKERLKGIADVFLVHNRPIIRPVDDSVVRIMAGREMVLRRARGYAPLPIRINQDPPKAVSVGGHLKNAVAIAIANNIFVSQHIGDLETALSYETFQKTIESFYKLYDFRPEMIIHDAHPSYSSTIYADKTGLPALAVQHHQAHILSCMAENEIFPPLLGVAWDGTGHGLDGTIWGGEFFRADEGGFVRIARFLPFPMAGGEKAIKEPRRAALGMLYKIFGDSVWNNSRFNIGSLFSQREAHILMDMLAKNINIAQTSSVGRIFDAVSAIIGLGKTNNFEGQGAMKLEFVIGAEKSDLAYNIELINSESVYILDWRQMLMELMDDFKKKVSPAIISIKFHNALARSIVAVAERVGEKKVALSGGCFQNKYLTETTVNYLQNAGFRPYWHQRIPPNDGGIALGQALAPSYLKMEKT